MQNRFNGNIAIHISFDFQDYVEKRSFHHFSIDRIVHIRGINCFLARVVLQNGNLLLAGAESSVALKSSFHQCDNNKHTCNMFFRDQSKGQKETQLSKENSWVIEWQEVFPRPSRIRERELCERHHRTAWRGE